MPNFVEVIVALGGYPVQEILKDMSDLRAGHKVTRNCIRLLSAAAGFGLGLALPLWISPVYGGYLSAIFLKAFDFGTVPSEITSVMASIWGTTYLALGISKQACRGFCLLYYGDTNTDHILTKNKLAHLSEVYIKELPITDPSLISPHVRGIFDFLVAKIRKTKFLERNAKQGFNVLDTLQHEISKAEYKFILHEFLAGNIDPYDNYAILEKEKQKIIGDKLRQRIDYIYAAYFPEAASLRRGSQSHQSISHESQLLTRRQGNQGARSLIQPLPRHQQQPSISEALPLDTSEPQMAEDALIDEGQETRISVVLDEPTPPRRSISRMMVQWSDFNRPKQLQKDEASLQKLIKLLNEQIVTLHNQAQDIPLPAPLIPLREGIDLPPPARPSIPRRA